MATLTITLAIKKEALETWVSQRLGVHAQLTTDDAARGVIEQFLKEQSINLLHIRVAIDGHPWGYLDENEPIFVVLSGNGPEYERACRAIGQFSN